LLSEINKKIGLKYTRAGRGICQFRDLSCKAGQELIILLRTLCDAGLFGFVFGISALKLGLIGFELGLFFFQIAVFGPKTAKIGFVLHN